MGCEAFGALAIPAGPGNLDMQCEFLVDFETTVMCCTASMGLLLADYFLKIGLFARILGYPIIYLAYTFGGENFLRLLRL